MGCGCKKHGYKNTSVQEELASPSNASIKIDNGFSAIPNVTKIYCSSQETPACGCAVEKPTTCCKKRCTCKRRRCGCGSFLGYNGFFF